jgi:hypothetical protein
MRTRVVIPYIASIEVLVEHDESSKCSKDDLIEIALEKLEDFNFEDTDTITIGYGQFYTHIVKGNVCYSHINEAYIEDE